MVYYKMTEISVEHILLFVVIVCFINYFMGSSRCGFSVGAQGSDRTPGRLHRRWGLPWHGFKVGGQGPWAAEGGFKVGGRHHSSIGQW
jgi:hypothetical protein